MDRVNNNQKFYRPKPKNDKALPTNRHFIPDEMKKVAESYEKQFAQFLLKEFHKSIPKSQDESTAGNIYESWMINEQSDAISKNDKGIGIKDLILEEIYPRKYRNEQAYEGYLQSRANRVLQAKNAYKQAKMKETGFDQVEMSERTNINSAGAQKGASNE